MGHGSSDLSIEDLTTGISKSGMEQFQEDIKINILVNISEKIEDVAELEAAINAGWQGASRDRFLKDFKEVRKAIIADLKEEYKDVEARLEEVKNNYFRQDNNLY